MDGQARHHDGESNEGHLPWSRNGVGAEVSRRPAQTRPPGYNTPLLRTGEISAKAYTATLSERRLDRSQATSTHGWLTCPVMKNNSAAVSWPTWRITQHSLCPCSTNTYLLRRNIGFHPWARRRAWQRGSFRFPKLLRASWYAMRDQTAPAPAKWWSRDRRSE